MKGEDLRKSRRTKRLHADATALSINLLAVASRLRPPSEIDRGGAGEPQSVRAT